MVAMTSSRSSIERMASVGNVNPSTWGMVPGSSRSAPEQKPLPAPVRTMTRMSLSSPMLRNASRKGIITSNAIAFMRSGRFKVTRATWGCGEETSTNAISGIVEGGGARQIDVASQWCPA